MSDEAAAFDGLREACDRIVSDVRDIADPVERARVGNERFGTRWVRIVYGDAD